MRWVKRIANTAAFLRKYAYSDKSTHPTKIKKINTFCPISSILTNPQHARPNVCTNACALVYFQLLIIRKKLFEKSNIFPPYCRSFPPVIVGAGCRGVDMSACQEWRLHQEIAVMIHLRRYVLKGDEGRLDVAKVLFSYISATSCGRNDTIELTAMEKD